MSMPMHIAFTHVVNPNNCGEMASCPAPYLNMRGHTNEIISIEKFPLNVRFDAVVIGGGGLFMPDLEDKVDGVIAIAKINNPKCKIVGWGLGSNYPHPTDEQWMHWSKEFDLIGVRDRNGVLPQLPCASCLHPLFDKRAPKLPEHPRTVSVYEHQDVPLKFEMPTMNNRCSINEAIAFMGAGNVVISGTYHGTYWALLMGRPVIFARPQSNSQDFRTDRLGVPVKVVTCDGTTLLTFPQVTTFFELIESTTQTFPNYLPACREANRRFEKQFFQMLENQSVSKTR